MATELWQQVDTDLYDALRIPPTAGDAAIHDAWRAAAKRSHPDRGGHRDEFDAVHVAYLVLSDPDLRARYDATRGRVLRPPATDQVIHVPPPVEEPWRDDAPREPRGRVVLVVVLGCLAAVLLSYVWPLVTLLCGIVVGVIVVKRYAALRDRHRRRRR